MRMFSLKKHIYSPWVSWFLLSHYMQVLEHLFGEGNGNPLQCSCLENPREGGAWLPSMGSHRVGHGWSALAAAEHLLSASAVQLETLFGIRILNDMRKVHYVLLIIIFFFLSFKKYFIYFFFVNYYFFKQV